MQSNQEYTDLETSKALKAVGVPHPSGETYTGADGVERPRPAAAWVGDTEPATESNTFLAFEGDDYDGQDFMDECNLYKICIPAWSIDDLKARLPAEIVIPDPKGTATVYTAEGGGMIELVSEAARRATYDECMEFDGFCPVVYRALKGVVFKLGVYNNGYFYNVIGGNKLVTKAWSESFELAELVINIHNLKSTALRTLLASITKVVDPSTVHHWTKDGYFNAGWHADFGDENGDNIQFLGEDYSRAMGNLYDENFIKNLKRDIQERKDQTANF